MSLIVYPYVFQPGTTIASAQVNANFAAISNVVNGNLDGSNFSTVFTSTNLSAKGHVTIAGGLILQWASVANVAFDNSSASSPTFDITFANACLGVITQVIENTQSGGSKPMVTAYVAPNPSTSGFTLTAMGGQAGSTGNVYYWAWGY